MRTPKISRAVVALSLAFPLLPWCGETTQTPPAERHWTPGRLPTPRERARAAAEHCLTDGHDCDEESTSPAPAGSSGDQPPPGGSP